jgi:hypothetical protein
MTRDAHYQPDAQARDSTNQMTRDAHYQPDAQAREPEVHHTLEGRGLGPSLARRVGVGPDVSDVVLSCEFPHGGSPNATNEPTAAHDITANELTDAGKNETNERKQDGKPGNPPKGREARSGQTRKKETAGRIKEELDKLVNMVLELQKQACRPSN